MTSVIKSIIFLQQKKLVNHPHTMQQDSHKAKGSVDQSDCELFFTSCKCCNKIFHVFDFIVAGFLIMDAFFLLTEVDSFAGFLLPIYFILFGCSISLFIIYVPISIYLTIPFYFTFTGRGVLYMFLGTVILVFTDELSIITGVIIWIIAFTYMIISIMNKFCTKKCDFDIVLPPPLIQQNNDTKSNKVKPTKIKQTNKRPRTPSSSFENDKITKHKLKTMETVSNHNQTVQEQHAVIIEEGNELL
eukprot:341488_1